MLAHDYVCSDFTVFQYPQLADNYAYSIVNLESKSALVIDGPLGQPIVDHLKSLRIKNVAVLNTHHHWDHIGVNVDLQKHFPGTRIYGFEGDEHRIPGITDRIQDQQELEVLGFSSKVFFTPGHTLGHVSFYFERNSVLFCGDTLFSGGCGKLFEGTPAQMVHSLYEQILSLPLNTVCFCAHEYTLKNLEFALSIEPESQELKDRFNEVQGLRSKNQPTVPFTLEEELKTNPFLRICEPSLVSALENQGLRKGGNSIEAFGFLRRLKDQF